MTKFKFGKGRPFLMAFAAMLTVANVAMADDYTAVTFVGKDGEKTVLPCDGMRITFDGGQIKVKYISGQSIFNTADMASFFFSNLETSIETITTADEGQVAVFTPTGKQAGIFNSVEEAQIRLPKGVYIFKEQDTTGKFIVK